MGLVNFLANSKSGKPLGTNIAFFSIVQKAIDSKIYELATIFLTWVWIPQPPHQQSKKNGILVPRGFLSLNIFKCLKKMHTSPIPYLQKTFENRRQETCFANTPSRDKSNHLQCHILRRVLRICAQRHATSPSGVQIFGPITSLLFL